MAMTIDQLLEENRQLSIQKEIVERENRELRGRIDKLIAAVMRTRDNRDRYKNNMEMLKDLLDEQKAKTKKVRLENFELKQLINNKK